MKNMNVVGNQENDGTLSQYLSNRRLLDAANVRATDICKKINTAEEQRERGASNLPNLEVFERELENLMAARALGEVTEAEVEIRRAQIFENRRVAEEQRQNVEAGVVVSVQSIGGLKRLLSETQSEIRALEIRDRELFTAVLISEAEETGGRYAKAAQALIQEMLSLEYLGQLLAPSNSGYGRNIHISANNVNQVFIPAFILRNVQELCESGRTNVLYDGLRLGHRGMRDKAREDEKKRLRSLGLQFPDYVNNDWYSGPEEEAQAVCAAQPD